MRPTIFKTPMYGNLPDLHTIYMDTGSQSLEKSNLCMIETITGAIAFGRFFRQNRQDVQFLVQYTVSVQEHPDLTFKEPQITLPLSEIVFWSEVPMDMKKNYIIVV